MRLYGPAVLTASILLQACAILPDGPTVIALPGTGLSLESFQNDDRLCQSFALSQISSNQSPEITVHNGPSRSWYNSQQRYDISYIQCMYTKGHRVPVNGQFSPVMPLSNTEAGIPKAPLNSHIPPPPAGTPPPPPPLK